MANKSITDCATERKGTVTLVTKSGPRVFGVYHQETKLLLRNSGLLHATGGEFVVPMIHDRGRGRGDNGECRGLSAKSAQRFVVDMSSKTLSDGNGNPRECWYFGFTGTLYWVNTGKNWTQICECYKELVKQFWKWVSRHYSDCAGWYRNECQGAKEGVEGKPHFHALMMFPILNPNEAMRRLGITEALAPEKAESATRYAVGQELKEKWFQLQHSIGEKAGFELHDIKGYEVAFKTSDVPSTGAMKRYMAKHCGKTKTFQNYYPGKAWGRFGRNFFDLGSVDLLAGLDEWTKTRVLDLMNREMRKARRFCFTAGYWAKKVNARGELFPRYNTPFNRRLWTKFRHSNGLCLGFKERCRGRFYPRSTGFQAFARWTDSLTAPVVLKLFRNCLRNVNMSDVPF